MQVGGCTLQPETVCRLFGACASARGKGEPLRVESTQLQSRASSCDWLAACCGISPSSKDPDPPFHAPLCRHAHIRSPACSQHGQAGMITWVDPGGPLATWLGSAGRFRSPGLAGKAWVLYKG